MSTLSDTWRTLNAGAPGIAYALLHFYRLSGASAYLVNALQLCELLSRHLYELQLPDEVEIERYPTSLFHSETGLWWVCALCYLEAGDWKRCESSLKNFVNSASSPTQVLDISLGLAGTLLASLNLREALLSSGQSSAILDALISRQSMELDSRLAYALEHETHSLTKTFAHGTAGIAFVLLRIAKDGKPSDLVFSVLRSLWLARTGDEISLAFRLSPEADDTSWGPSSWCNGVTGVVHLYVLAYQVLGDPEYLDIASRAAFFAGQQTHGHATSICCGTAGQAYAMFSMYNATHEPAWKQRGIEFSELTALRLLNFSQKSSSDRGLYKGDLGGGLLAIQSMQLSHPEMPVIYPIERR